MNNNSKEKCVDFVKIARVYYDEFINKKLKLNIFNNNIDIYNEVITKEKFLFFCDLFSHEINSLEKFIVYMEFYFNPNIWIKLFNYNNNDSSIDNKSLDEKKQNKYTNELYENLLRFIKYNKGTNIKKNDIYLIHNNEIQFIFKNYSHLAYGIPIIGNICLYTYIKNDVYILVAKDSYIYRKDYKSKRIQNIIRDSASLFGIDSINFNIEINNDEYKPKYGIIGGRCHSNNIYNTISKEFIEETMGLILDFDTEDKIIEMIFEKRYYKKITLSAYENKQIITYLKKYKFENDLFNKTYDLFNLLIDISLCYEIIEKVDGIIDFSYHKYKDIEKYIINNINNVPHESQDNILKWKVFQHDKNFAIAKLKNGEVILDLKRIYGNNSKFISYFNLRNSLINYQKFIIKEKIKDKNNVYLLYDQEKLTYNIKKGFLEKCKIGWIKLERIMEWLIHDIENGYNKTSKINKNGFINYNFIPVLIIVYKILINKETDNIRFNIDEIYNKLKKMNNSTYFYSLEDGKEQ